MSSCLVEVRGGGGEGRTGLELMDLLGPLLSCSNHMQLLLVGKSVYGCCTWLIETMSLTLCTSPEQRALLSAAGKRFVWNYVILTSRETEGSYR